LSSYLPASSINPGGPPVNAAKVKADVIVLAKSVARHL